MAYKGQISRRQRALSAFGALTVVVAVGLGLASGFDIAVVRTISDAMSAIALPAPKPPEPPSTPSPSESTKAAGAASAANLDAKAAPVLAPKPQLPPRTPPPIAAAPKPSTGSDASAGAATVAGPGSGADGRGDGLGSGGAGDGSGGGTRPIWRSGRIKDSDYPKAASRGKIGGEVEVRFIIEPTGHVTGCRTTRSSGDPSLDLTTCRLIEQRFRFKPATNAAGMPVASDYGWRQSWWLERRR